MDSGLLAFWSCINAREPRAKRLGLGIHTKRQGLGQQVRGPDRADVRTQHGDTVRDACEFVDAEPDGAVLRYLLRVARFVLLYLVLVRVDKPPYWIPSAV